jgi:hypothetical protein
MRLLIDPAATPADLLPILETLAESFPIRLGAGDGGAEELRVRFEPGAGKGTLEIRRHDGTAVVAYDRPAHACRGLGTLLAGLVPDGGTCRESTPFESVGIMLDCSRNAVMTVSHFQRWLRQLALLGYNQAMLYTEDTYELPGEDYFGYLRGRYTADELRAVDAYAARLGIELVGCIQTLGHLEQALKWDAYRPVRDTSSVLLVGEEPTYALIEKMVGQIAATVRSRRIHVGMDETHDLGRGRYLDQFGYTRGYDLFNRHLARVVAICEKQGLKPMIWSDMYFRMGSKNMDYYDAACRIPEDVRRAIPPQAQLVYWDYYHKERAFYLDWIQRHRDLGFEPVMASGVWTWGLPWYGRAITESTVVPCVSACREAGLREITFTLWGDDGGYCEFDSALAGLAFAAEACYGGDQPDPARLAARFAAVCGADYEAVLAASDMLEPMNPMLLVWDDPLLRIGWKNHNLAKPGDWPRIAAHYAKIARRLSKHRHEVEPVDLAHAVTLLRFAQAKIRLNQAVDAAYASRDPHDFAAAGRQLRAAIGAFNKLSASFRRQWYRRNKPFGFETLQVRLGGQRQRLQELGTRLEELAIGRIDAIPELEAVATKTIGRFSGGWRHLAAAGIL